MSLVWYSIQFQNINYLIFEIILILIFFIIGLYYLSIHTTQKILLPLNQIEKRIRQINAGDFGLVLTTPNILEVAELAESINSMSDRLKLQFRDLSIEKEKFNSLLQNLKEGVFAIDVNQIVLFQNFNLPKTLIPQGSQSRHIKDVIKQKKLYEFLRAHIEKEVEGKINIEIRDQYFSVTLHILRSGDGKIVMYIGHIRDKTEEQKRQIMREEFVQSASHELKTPITSIKGYAETLYLRLSPNNDTNERKFLNAILRNTDRMIRIIDDMLTISKLESNNMLFQPEKFKFIELIDDIKLTIEGFLGLKSQELRIDAPENLEIYADYVLLEHLLLNLIQNASNYSPENKMIELKTEISDTYVLIKVKDNGIGIGEEDINRIFERFYRVDKNRSRKEGGTGLGLSIVKHIARLHSGWMSVNSQIDVGSTFTFHLPIRR